MALRSLSLPFPAGLQGTFTNSDGAQRVDGLSEGSFTRYAYFDWVRLAMAVSVVLSHVNGNSGNPWTLYMLAPPVPTFLAVSGFLVLGSWETSGSARYFWIKRALRVLPAMGVALLLSLAVLGTRGFVESLQMYFTLGFALKYYGNAPLWSLGVEELFYLALTVLASLSVYRRWPILIWILFLLSAALSWYAGDVTEEARRLLHLPCAFLLGNLAYMNRDKLLKFKDWAIPFLFAAVLSRVIEQWIYTPVPDNTNNPGSVFVYIPELLAVVLFCISKEGESGLKWDLSYGIYIYHWIFITYLVQVRHHADVRLLVETLGAAAVCAALSWVFVESRALAMKGRFRPRTKPAPEPA